MPDTDLPLDAQVLLLRLDLKTERLLAEAEALVLAIANRQAAIASQEAAHEARDARSVA